MSAYDADEEPFFPLPEADLRYAGVELQIARFSQQLDELMAEVLREAGQP